MQQKLERYPFGWIASQGLGVVNSSLDKIGNLVSLKKYGGAGIQFFPNIATGNLVVKDRVLCLEDTVGKIELFYTYNSQAKDVSNLWKFSHKKFISISSSNQTVVLQESDGHQTTYSLDITTGFYFAPACSGQGTPWVRFDADNQQWIWTHPGKNITEYYDLEGNLFKHIDMQGRVISYEYDNNKALSAIVGQSGSRYEIRRSDKTISIYLAVNNLGDQLLQQYQFDELGRLIISQTADGYKTIYSYGSSEDSWKLLNIQQSDQSLLAFNYDQTKKLSGFTLGEEADYKIQYADSNNSKVLIQDGINSMTQIGLDAEFNITNISRPRGYEDSDKSYDTTSYTYTESSQLESVIKPDKSEEKFSYINKFGLIQTHTEPNGQITEKIYQQDKNKIILIGEIKSEYDEKLVSRYVYDANYDSNSNIFQRFKISPEGRVTEYRPDKNGNIASKRKYMNSKIDLSQSDVHSSPSLSEMLDWVSNQDPSQINLTDYAYNDRCQLIRTRRYAHIDPQGNGIIDKQMGEEIVYPDLYGNCVTKQIKQDDKNTAINKRTFDSLQRLTSETDALNQITTYKYIDTQNQVQITYPNGKVEVYQKDKKNKIIQKQESVNSQTRTTQYGRDSQGRVVTTTRPDGKSLYSFYDYQDRLGFTVSALGIVTEYRYDVENRCNTQIQYINSIDPKELFLIYPPPAGSLPSVSKLISLLSGIQDLDKDRVIYKITDESGRLIYSIDSENIVTQYFYNIRNLKTAEITYIKPLSDDDLKKLISGQKITLTPDFLQDRGKRYFYDNDGYLIAKQDSAGYITEYSRDNAGKVKHKILYANKITIDININNYNIIKLSLVKSEKDVHNYYYRDAKGKITGELNSGDDSGEYYYTQYNYYANGLKQQTLKYAEKVIEISDILPAANPDKDRVTNYQYDLLNRSVDIELTDQNINLMQYDTMNNMIFNQHRDSEDIFNESPDHQRTTTAHYDGWNQKDQETNVFGGKISHYFDATGLKLHTTDALNHTTYYFYDSDRRLVATVGPTGIITENILDNFGNIIKIKKYSQKIAELKNFEGGYLTDEIHKLFIENPDQDQITVLTRNKSGLISQKTDPQNNIYTYSYNAFKECVTEQIPVNTPQPTLTKTHTFDVRGLEISTITSTPDMDSEIIVRRYDNLYGKETGRLNTRGGFYSTDYTVRGKVKSKSQFDGTITSQHQFTYTAFEELASEKDSLGNITIHEYDQTKRTHRINYPIQGMTEVLTQNIFNEVISKQDSLGNTQYWTHAPHGKIETYTDQLGNQSYQNYDLMGQLAQKTDANNTKTEYQYDQVGFLVSQTEDILGQKYQTVTERDSFGNGITITDPRQVITQNIFDQNNNLIESILDNQLSITTKKTYNAQGKLTGQIQGDKDNPDQYKESYQIDSRNRNIGKIIDPEGLKVNTEKKLNTSGDVIAEIDGNGNTTRKFYNALGKLRFIIDPEGGVSETNYDTEGRIAYTRVYANGLDTNKLNDQSNLTTVLNIIKIDSQDTLLYHYYDTDGKERFQVNSQGLVEERQYNLARQEIKLIKYASIIDPQVLSNLTTEKLINLIKSDPKDRIIYKIRDNKNQERFLIDSENYLSEKRYDNNGNIIARIKYAIKLTDPQKIANLPSDQVLNNIILDNINRVIYQIFDSRNKPQYIVDGEGYVTQFWHDENENLVQTCRYKNSITVPKDYQALKNLLKSLIPDSTIDSITQSEFDAANRKISETDALGYIDKFKKDILGNTIVHTDRANNDWLYHYDSANRLDSETTPSVPVSVIQNNQISNNISLSSLQMTLAIQDKKSHDNNGNELQITKASNSAQPRNLSCIYNKNNQLVQTKVDHILINDESKPADFNNSPVKTVDVTTQIIYNSKKLKICEQNEAGAWHFYVYNSEGKLVYEINALGVITEYIRNTFGEIISETVYANKINLDLMRYIQTGISLSIIEQPGIITPDKTQDRTRTYDRDHRGDVISTKFGPALYYLPNGTDHPHYMTDDAEIKQQYNAFRECACKQVLLVTDPSGSKSYSQQLYWFNRNGKIIAECDPVFRVIKHVYNSAGYEIEHSEWASPPKEFPTSDTTLAELDKNYVNSPKDRNYEYSYNLAGLCVQKTIKNAVIQQAVLDNNNIPSMKDLPPQDLKQIYIYNAIQKRISITYEDGSIAYNYYDARGLQIAVTDVARQDVNGKTLVPLSYFGNDVFGSRVATTRFKQGTIAASPNQLPVPIAHDPDDQVDYQYLDNRGLVQYTQNAEGTINAFTYTAHRKTARQFYYLTNSDARHIDEKNFEYDQLNHLITMTVLRDHKVVQTTVSQYNSFGNCIAEGPGDGTYPLYRRYDQMNNCWADNIDGVAKINLYNLSANKTLLAKSATQDLSIVTYDKLDDILALKPADLERTEVQYDHAGRKIAQTLPIASIPDPDDPANVPINIISGNSYPAFGKVSLTWIQPQETNYVLKLKLWQTGAPDQKYDLPIKTLNGRCGVDVSNFVTDVYTYEMDYFFTNPITNQLDIHPRYRTTGQVEFDTGNISKSLMLVVSVTDGYILNLTGNTAGITAVELWEGSIKLDQIPVQNQNGKLSVNLSKYYSGVYTVVPIVPGKNDLPGSLGFTIHTPTPAKSPLSQQIDVAFDLLNIWLWLEEPYNPNDPLEGTDMYPGQLNWRISSKAYQQYPVNLGFKYVQLIYSGLGACQVTIKPGEIKNTFGKDETFQEKEYGIPACNFYYIPNHRGPGAGYARAAVKIQDLSLSLQLNSTEILPLANAIQPYVTSGTGVPWPGGGVLHSLFPTISVLYITPMTGFSTPPVLEYLDVTMDRLATWKKLQILGMTSQGIVVDVTGMEPCIYPFKIADQLTFWEGSHKLKRTLRGKLPDSLNSNKTEEFSQFREVIPERKQTSVSFKLLQTDRKTVVEVLENQKDDEITRQTIAPEIYEALMLNTFKVPDEDWEMLKDRYNKELEVYRKLEATLSQRKIIQNIEINQIQLQQAQISLLNIKSKILKYCEKSEIYSSYVNHLKNNNNSEMGVETALLYAKHKNMSIYFWQKDPDNKGQIKLIASHDASEIPPNPPLPKGGIKTLHFEITGFGHYNVLLPEGISLESIYGDQPAWSFTVNPPDGKPYPSDQYPPEPPLQIQPGYLYTRDAWNNLTQVIDTLGNETDYDYGYKSQRLSQTQPEVYIAQADGSIKPGNPVTKWGYNARAQKIAMTDPNGNTEAYILDSSGQEKIRIDGSGLEVREQVYGALGELIAHINPQKNSYQYQYNHLNKITKIIYPSGLTTSYIYNELYRKKDIDQLNLPTTYDYDALGNIMVKTSPTGLKTIQAFDRNHQITQIINPDAMQLRWSRNYFGQELTHTDVDLVYINEHDHKNQVIRRYVSAGSRACFESEVMSYIIPGQSGTNFETIIWNTPQQDITFQYDAGRLVLVLDASYSSYGGYTEYQYDTENRQIAVLRAGEIIHTSINALGECDWTNDSGTAVSVICNANRSRETITIIGIVNKSISYKYDAANRVIYDGVTGLTLTYDAGLRVKETNGSGLYRTLAYDIDGRLTDINYYQISPGSVITAHRGYTGNGYLYDYTEAKNGVVYYKHGITFYNNEYWQSIDWQSMDNNLVSQTNYSNFTNTGLPRSQYTQYANDIQDNMTNNYAVYGDQLQLVAVSGQRHDQYGWSNCSIATKYFNSKNMVSAMTGLQVENQQDPNSKEVTSKFFQSTYDGKILYSLTCTGTLVKNPGVPGTLYNGTSVQSRNYYDSQGRLIASYGSDINNPEVYGVRLNYLQLTVNQIESNFPKIFQKFKGIDAFGGMFRREFEQIGNALQQEKVTNFEIQAHAPHLNLSDFTQTYPAQISQERYTVAPGDTFESIAERLSGDVNYASAIAAVNPKAVGESLEVGETLILPQFMPTTNNINNFTSYGPLLDLMIGNLYPKLDLKQPPPPKPKSGGFMDSVLGDVIHAVVDFVASAIGFFFMGGPTGAALLTTFADAAFQEAVTGRVNVLAALVAGMEAGVSAKVMQAFGAAAKAGTASGVAETIGTALGIGSSQTVLEAMSSALVISTVDQGIEILAGLRKDFDPEAIFIAMGAAGLMNKVAPVEDKILGVDQDKFIGKFINNETQGLLEGELEHVIEGQKLDIEMISAKALGVTVAQTVGNSIKSEIETIQLKKQFNHAVAYMDAMGDSVSPNTDSAGNTIYPKSNQNPGRNRNGFFSSGTKQQGNQSTQSQQTQTSNQQKSNTNNINWLTVDPNDTDKLLPGSSQLLNQSETVNQSNILTEFVKNLEDPVDWTETTIDKTGDYLDKNKLPVYEERYQEYWDQAISLSNEAKSVAWDDPAKAYKLNSMANQSYNLAAKNGLFSGSIKAADVARKSFTLADIATGASNILAATPENLIQVDLEQVGRSVGGMAGGFLGVLASIPVESAGPVVGIPVQVVSTVVSSEILSDLGEYGADELYEWIKPKMGGF